MSIAEIVAYEIRCNACEEILREPNQDYFVTCDSPAEAIAYLAGPDGQGWTVLPDGRIYCPTDTPQPSRTAAAEPSHVDAEDPSRSDRHDPSRQDPEQPSPRRRVLTALRNADQGGADQDDAGSLTVDQLAARTGLPDDLVLDQLCRLRALGIARQDHQSSRSGWRAVSRTVA